MTHDLKNKIFAAILIFGIFFFTPVSVFAHVSVKPSEVGAASFQTFTVGVPNEKDNPTVGLRLVIPAGLQHVSPNVKPGWTINVQKSGEGDDATTTEIEWTGGSIPSGQRDEFLFTAQVPADETTLQWKAYQTYQDGTVVAWDQSPKQKHSDTEENHDAGPYSETKIINDLASEDTNDHHADTPAATGNPALPISIGAFVLAAAALALQLMKKK